MNIQDLINLLDEKDLNKPIIINGDCVAFMISDVKIEDELIRLEVEEVVRLEE